MRLMLYLHSSVVQGLKAHGNKDPGVLYRILYCGVDMIKSTLRSTSLTVASRSWLASFFKTSSKTIM